MKTVASFIRVLFVLLIPVGVCQCSGNYNLVDYKEYGCCDKLEDHISYNYNDAGELKSKTRLRWGWGQENTLTLYEVKRYDTGIDTMWKRGQSPFPRIKDVFVSFLSLDDI